jgi:hypothetical protein
MFLRDYPQRYQPHRALLKHHFRQAVLCNMKARGPEYDWDEDITPVFSTTATWLQYWLRNSVVQPPANPASANCPLYLQSLLHHHLIMMS